MKTKYVLCRDINNQKHKVLCSRLKFRPAAYGVLIEKGKVLLSKQWDGYDFPGGGIKIDELIDGALEREFWEETGLKVKRLSVLICESCFYRTYFSKKPINSIVMYFLVKRVGGKLNLDNIDGTEKKYLGMPEWIPLKQINKIKFYNSIDSVKLIREAVKALK